MMGCTLLQSWCFLLLSSEAKRRALCRGPWDLLGHIHFLYINMQINRSNLTSQRTLIVLSSLLRLAWPESLRFGDGGGSLTVQRGVKASYGVRPPISA